MEYPHFCGLNLDVGSTLSGDNDVEVDIAADYYWKFVTGTIRRGDKPGPAAISFPEPAILLSRNQRLWDNP